MNQIESNRINPNTSQSNNSMMNNSNKNSESPKRPGPNEENRFKMPATSGGLMSSRSASMRRADLTAVSAAVTPSPVVNRAQGRAFAPSAGPSFRPSPAKLNFEPTETTLRRATSDEKEATEIMDVEPQQKEHDPEAESKTEPSSSKRSHLEQTSLDDVIVKTKRAKLPDKSSAPYPKSNEMQTFKSLTVYPPNKDMSVEEQTKAISHLHKHCLATEILRIKENDLVVTTQSLGTNAPTGTVGKVIGWTSIGDIRRGLGSHIRELRDSPDKAGHQQEYEIDVTHKHAVDAIPAPYYPNVVFQGKDEQEEGTVLPECFTDIVPEIGRMGMIQLPLLRVPLCRCRPAAPAKFLRCHNHGPNDGRWFFTCVRPIGSQCGYFMWKTVKQQDESAPKLKSSSK